MRSRIVAGALGAAAVLGLGVTAALAAPFMIVGNDEKLIWDGLDWVSHDGEEVWGIQRLRLHLGIPQGVTRIAFVYQMFVRFGDIPVPPRSNAIQGG